MLLRMCLHVEELGHFPPSFSGFLSAPMFVQVYIVIVKVNK
jgi:hypothetical protein